MEQDENAELTAKLHAHQSKAGRAGGRSRSEAKRAAVRANLAKARLRRWLGREAAARAAAVPIPGAAVPEQGEVDAHPREKERPLPQGSGGAIQEQGPLGPSPLPDQPNSRDGQPANGGFNLLRFAKERG